MEIKEILKFLKANKSILSFSGIERKLGCPGGVITRAINKKEDLPMKWEQPLADFVSKTFNTDK